jgi:hypothetical protein
MLAWLAEQAVLESQARAMGSPIDGETGAAEAAYGGTGLAEPAYGQSEAGRAGGSQSEAGRAGGSQSEAGRAGGSQSEAGGSQFGGMGLAEVAYEGSGKLVEGLIAAGLISAAEAVAGAAGGGAGLGGGGGSEGGGGGGGHEDRGGEGGGSGAGDVPFEDATHTPEHMLDPLTAAAAAAGWTFAAAAGAGEHAMKAAAAVPMDNGIDEGRPRGRGFIANKRSTVIRIDKSNQRVCMSLQVEVSQLPYRLTCLFSLSLLRGTVTGHAAELMTAEDEEETEEVGRAEGAPRTMPPPRRRHRALAAVPVQCGGFPGVFLTRRAMFRCMCEADHEASGLLLASTRWTLSLLLFLLASV